MRSERTSPLRYRGGIRPKLLLAAVLIGSFFLILQSDQRGSAGEGRRFAVIWRYYGLGAEEIERVLTISMEDAVSDLPGISELKTSSEYSVSRMDINLTVSADPAAFRIDLGKRIDGCYAALQSRHPGAQRPVIVSAGTDQSPIFAVSFSMAGRTPAQLRPLIEDEVKQSYSRISGAGEVIITGGAMSEIHVELDSGKAAAAGLCCGDIAAMIGNADTLTPAGRLDDGLLCIPLTLDARLRTVDELRRLPAGGGTRLDDIADAGFGERRPDEISRIQGRESICLQVKSSSPNLIPVARALRAETGKWEKNGLTAKIIYDRGRELERALKRVVAALASGIALSTLVLMIFSPDRGRIILLSLGQPVLMITTFGAVSAAGTAFDRFFLAGLAAGTGLVLDSALLLTEAMREPEKGKVPEIRPALISSAASTLLSLLPLLVLKDEVPGLLPLVTALGTMTGLSLVLSLIFIPAFYRPPPAAPRMGGCLGRIKNAMLGGPERSPGIKSRIPAAAAAALLFSGTLSLLLTPTELKSAATGNAVFARLETEAGECPSSVDSKMTALSEKLSSLKGVSVIQTTSGRGGGDLMIMFDPAGIRRERLLAGMRRAGQEIPGAFLYIPEGRGRDSLELSVRITGPDNDRLKSTAEETAERILCRGLGAGSGTPFPGGPSVAALPDKPGGGRPLRAESAAGGGLPQMEPSGTRGRKMAGVRYGERSQGVFQRGRRLPLRGARFAVDGGPGRQPSPAGSDWQLRGGANSVKNRENKPAALRRIHDHLLRDGS